MNNYLPVTANGKTYLAAPLGLRAHKTIRHGIVVTLSYFSTRDGKRFGPIRTAAHNDAPKSVGGQIFAQVAESLNADIDAMIAEATRLVEEFEVYRRSPEFTQGTYPSVKLITRS